MTSYYLYLTMILFYQESQVDPENENSLEMSKNVDRSSSFWLSTNNTSNNARKHLEIILTLEPLLDDHLSLIKSMLTTLPEKNKIRIIKWLSILIPVSALTMSLLVKNMRVPGLIGLTSLASLTIYKSYTDSKSQRQLKSLITIQNDVFNLHKKALKILKNDYKIKLDHKRVQKKFIKLEVYRLKHLQPICEYLLRSIENCCNLFCKASRILVDYLPESIEINNMITKFENNTFGINGEITYQSLKQLFYTYVLVQSDMMYVFALIYNSSLSEKENIHLKLSKITHHLYTQLKKDQDKLKFIVDEYHKNIITPSPRKYRGNVGSKWQDLYMHVDLLSKELQSAYDSVGLILEDIDNRLSSQDDDKLVESIKQKINEAHSKIVTARNYSEFNTLFINKFKNTLVPENIQQLDNSKLEEDDEEDKMINIKFDEDPDIMDEVFEEYIKEEYLKPLYDNDDDDDISVERAKLDKLLEQNFMTELKDVLIDKFRAMSDREAKAVLRQNNNQSNDKCQVNVEVISSLPIPPLVDEKQHICSSPPIPPPLPLVALELQDDYCTIEDKLIRPPVPLPRTMKSYSSGVEKDFEEEEEEDDELGQRFSIHMAVENIKLPKFTMTEETFIGSGENSEEELEESDDDVDD